ncbi:hypothetical protein NP493_620g00007 [Ridgeia piscesae]|uniref:CUB domain-containing protein n=1 Tax=Ridgeia piscesae TaxID=27915 RepID=A0AAD9KT94_RIDPI|nr:hypothetical protein NP493_620g00007 [Ridgeia piscesae]
MSLLCELGIQCQYSQSSGVTALRICKDLRYSESRPFSTAAYTGMRNCLFAVVHIVWLVTLRLHLVATCSGRSVLNATTGVITDGTGNYPVSASCEWLIDVMP